MTLCNCNSVFIPTIVDGYGETGTYYCSRCGRIVDHSELPQKDYPEQGYRCTNLAPNFRRTEQAKLKPCPNCGGSVVRQHIRGPGGEYEARVCMTCSFHSEGE